jgi:hypothetical protein
MVAGAGLIASQRAESQSPAGPKGSPVARAGEAVDKVIADLKEARKLVPTISDKTLREKLELLISRAELSAGDVRKELMDLMHATPARPSAGMPAPEFAKFLEALKKNAFDKDKVTFMQNFGARQPFTCEQAATLLKTFSFDDGRSEAAAVLYPNLLDPGNFYQVLDVFTFDSNKAALRKKLGLK